MDNIYISVPTEQNITIKVNDFGVPVPGPKGDPFRYEDFTQEQLESIRGPKGNDWIPTEEEKTEIAHAAAAFIHIPSNVSELNNDSGYLTEHQDISGKADKATTLRGYGITDAQTKIDSLHKLSSDYISDVDKTNKFVTSSEKTTWNSKYDKPNDGIPKSDLSASVQYSLNRANIALTVHQDISYKADRANTLSGYGINDAYTKNEVDAKISSVYKYRGSVPLYSSLPSEDLVIGDVYNVEYDGSNYAWTGTTWDKLGGDVDLSGYQSKIDSLHKLSSDLVDDANKTNKFVTSSEKTTWNSKYDKPSGGIPKTDLASSVQTSLDKADMSKNSIWKTTVAPTAVDGGYAFTISNLTGGDNTVQLGDMVLYSYYYYVVSDVTSTVATSATRTSIRGAKGTTGDTYTLTAADKTAIATEAAGMVNIPTKTSDLTNDSGFITSHQDISGKLNTAQGVANAGKFLVVGNDGNVTLTTLSAWQGGSY